jgi:hypothetical protein
MLFVLLTCLSVEDSKVNVLLGYLDAGLELTTFLWLE